ncbi:MAG: rod shape-determining protein MreD [Candidatus Omnitrophica bacterium]|nr:rod shape-determining protein MreD [Candidatus Omnitrophota bacterium]
MRSEIRKLPGIYLFFFMAFLAQIRFSPGSVWCPDFILLAVVFISIFGGMGNGVISGFLLGALRGFFSAHTLPADIVVFPLIALFSSMMSGMFYRNSPVLHIFVMLVAMISLVFAHTAYLNILTGNDIRFLSAVADNWRVVVVTLILSPIIFMPLNNYLERTGMI